jgi:PKD repeat protein
VNLTVTDNDGYATSVSQTIEVITYPSASFTWTPYPYAMISQPTVFNASSTSPGSGTITGYSWNFGDGNTTTTTNPIITHLFNATGSYTVTLTVINSYGLSSFATRSLNLYDTPYADFTWTPTIPTISQTVTFNASNSRSNGIMIVSYTWDFGDGTTPILTISPTTTHQFAAAGTYNVTLAVKNDAGLIGTISKEIVVVSQPKVEFAWTPTTPYAYDSAVFNASSCLSGGGIITSYTWNFGDSNVTATTSPVITHSYLVGGDYIVTLNVTNSYGLFNTTSKTISIAPAQAPIAGFAYSPLSPGVYEAVTFDASASVARGGVIISYSWDFGDGTTLTTATSIVYHNYQTAGNFSVTLNVTNTAAYSGVVTKQIVIAPISGPSASFTWFPIMPCFNQTIKFDASASTPGWNGTTHPPIAYYTWNFGDTNITSTTQPIIYHAYSAKGNYTVTLTVTDTDGAIGNLTKTLTVTGLIGDLNGDGKVDMRDIAIVARAFGSSPGDPYWNPIADLNGDGKIDMKDIAIVAKNYGLSA